MATPGDIRRFQVYQAESGMHPPTTPPPEVLSLRDRFYYASRVPDGIPKHIATGVLILIEGLPPGGWLCA
jgi:hypothetical protein